MSGYPIEVTSMRGLLDEGVAHIQKPFAPEGLASKVRDALDARA
jgi:hypothetical protein